MSFKVLEYWTDDPPVELEDGNYCNITSGKGRESGWYLRDISRGKRKGWKEVWVIRLGSDEFNSEIWRWRKRIVSPQNFKFAPRFPIQSTEEMRMAVQSKDKRTRARYSKIVLDTMGIVYSKEYGGWKKVSGD
jgi:hypothetical protein